MPEFSVGFVVLLEHLKSSCGADVFVPSGTFENSPALLVLGIQTEISIEVPLGTTELQDLFRPYGTFRFDTKLFPAPRCWAFVVRPWRDFKAAWPDHRSEFNPSKDTGTRPRCGPLERRRILDSRGIRDQSWRGGAKAEFDSGRRIYFNWS